MSHTTVHDRFHVCCQSCCGLVASYATRAEAQSHALSHNKQCEAALDFPATVYDVMARRGAPQEWNSHGGVLAYRTPLGSEAKP